MSKRLFRIGVNISITFGAIAYSITDNFVDLLVISMLTMILWGFLNQWFWNSKIQKNDR